MGLQAINTIIQICLTIHTYTCRPYMYLHHIYKYEFELCNLKGHNSLTLTLIHFIPLTCNVRETHLQNLTKAAALNSLYICFVICVHILVAHVSLTDTPPYTPQHTPTQIGRYYKLIW